MGNNDKTSEAFRLALLGYSRKDFDYITRLVNLIDLGKPLKLSVGDLSKMHNVQCDIAIAILDNISNLDTYNNHVTLVKQKSSNPPIICAAREADRSILESYRIGVKADHIIFMPIQLERFATVIHRLLGIGAANGGSNDTASPSAPRNVLSLAPSPIRLGELFVKSGLISKEDLDKALDHQKTTRLHIGDALIDLGIITEDQKLKCLAEQLKTTVAVPKQYASIDLNVAALIPEHTARRFNCIAIEKRGNNELVVAATDVLDLNMLDTLRDMTDMRITAILGKKEDIATSVDRCYRDISSHKDASRLAENMDEHVEYVKHKEKETGDEESAAAGAELGIIKLVNILITNAIRDHASDIHIEPMENELLVRYRVDGDMRKAMSPPKNSHHAIIARIKILSDLNIAERRLPQDGRMAIKIGQREVDIRVSILPTIFGEKAVLRILDKKTFEKNTASLGLTPYDERIFRSQIAKPYGLVIVTGPTGSGKSTTLYSALQAVKNVARNIITVEDPVEFQMDGINQVNVNTKTGLTFGAALRSILRQDPDIVLIGEIRDSETADIAIKMALTGHLVFSTLHTNDAASTIARFTDIGVPPLLLSSSLNLIVAQRLIRKICPKCKIEYKPAPELIQSLGLDPEQVTQLYKGNGCVTCNGTGFEGRTAIFEMLQITKNIRKLILKNASTLEIQEAAAAENMKTLRQTGIELALNGTTTIEQVLAATIEI
ncbi:MAG: Flp pilus assembly complex ATPase component TadA [Chitinispirillales bacterium]|jgi:type IV pilus assembly protein PilB|nr:Flp pilus assembly complex ATPase component TadA [Chitinispirillales bacterium]